MSKKKQLINNLEEIRKSLEMMGGDKSVIGLSLLDETMFMKQTLNDLKDKVKQDGVVTKMCQGSYTIERSNPALESYNKVIKNYQASIKLLNDLLGQSNSRELADELQNFVDA